MMVEFVCLVSKATGETYDVVQCRIRYVYLSIFLITFLSDVTGSCLMHTINLAAQALAAQAVIKGISSVKHFSLGDPATHEPNPDIHDVVAIIRATVVKVSLVFACLICR